MGTCYSKSGHEIDQSMKDNRPKEKKGSNRNGHLKVKKNPILIVDQVQMDVSDTVYTEDSHIVNALDIENCINKSQQTSLDHLAKESLKTPEVTEPGDSSSSHCNSVGRIAEDEIGDGLVDVSRDHPEEGDTQVVASDSGIVVEPGSGSGRDTEAGSQSTTDGGGRDVLSEHFESSLGEQPLVLVQETVPQNMVHDTEKSFQLTETIQSQVISNLKQSSELNSHKGHSSNVCCNGEKRWSVSSLDRLSESNKITDSTTDMDKIKIVLRPSSVSSSDQRQGTDQVDTSYELSTVSQQPEITTMIMNGREVVVIDAELFSQITDEIQFLKMKLSQLTEVIQETEISDTPKLDRSSRLSSLSSVS